MKTFEFTIQETEGAKLRVTATKTCKRPQMTKVYKENAQLLEEDKIFLHGYRVIRNLV